MVSLDFFINSEIFRNIAQEHAEAYADQVINDERKKNSDIGKFLEFLDNTEFTPEFIEDEFRFVTNEKPYENIDSFIEACSHKDMEKFIHDYIEDDCNGHVLRMGGPRPRTYVMKTINAHLKPLGIKIAKIYNSDYNHPVENKIVLVVDDSDHKIRSAYLKIYTTYLKKALKKSNDPKILKYYVSPVRTEYTGIAIGDMKYE